MGLELGCFHGGSVVSLGRTKCGWLVVILHILDIQRGTAWHSRGKPPILKVTNLFLNPVSMVW